MRFRLFERRSRRWVVVSVAAHVLIVATLAQVMFRYPLGQLLGIAQPEVRQEKLHYIELPKPPTEHSGGSRAITPRASAAPAALPTPSSIPTSLPPLVPLDSARALAAGGIGSGFGVVISSGNG